MKTDEAIAAEQRLEERLASVGADQIRRNTFSDEPAAPEPGTPANEPEPAAETVVEETAPVVEEPAAPTTVETPAVDGDAAVQAYLAKYGGDVNKALQAAVSASKKLGELGNDLGQTRQENAELERVVEELAQLKGRLDERPEPVQHVDAATVDWFDEQVLTNPAQAVEWARTQRNDLLFQRGIQTWKDIDPFAASQYVTDLKIANHDLRVNERIASQAPRGGNSVNDALANVIAARPEFAQYADDLGNVLANNTFAADAYKAAVASGDQKQIEGAIQTLFSLAEGDTLRHLALSGATPIDGRTTAEVATTTTSQDRPEAEPAKPSGVEQFRDQFREEAERLRKGAFSVS